MSLEGELDQHHFALFIPAVYLVPPRQKYGPVAADGDAKARVERDRMVRYVVLTDGLSF